jgi:Zn-dependent protease
MEELTLIQRISIWLLPILFAITLHEVAHGYVAYRLGDNTARSLGRLSLNPIHHIDPVGTLLVPGILLALGGFVFGWAKPVPVDYRRLKKPKRDMALVAVAGPLSNLAMAFCWAFLARAAGGMQTDFVSTPLGLMGLAGIAINVVLMVLNLLPIPPLDGGRVLVGLLPDRWSFALARLEPYGFYVLLALMATNTLTLVIGGPVHVLESFLFGVAGL